MKKQLHNSMKIMSFFLLATLLLVSCKKEDLDANQNTVGELDVVNVLDLIADTGFVQKYTYFSLRENAIVSPADSLTDKWDIAFAGTSIITNGGVSGIGSGGAVVVDGIFSELIMAPANFSTDTESALAIPTGSGNGWYTYTGPSVEPLHAILPTAGKVIMLRTADGKYAKIQILSYYQGNPDTSTPAFADLNTRPSTRYYNFKYVYQPNGSNVLN